VVKLEERVSVLVVVVALHCVVGEREVTYCR
jgi:hypothetical protein